MKFFENVPKVKYEGSKLKSEPVAVGSSEQAVK